MLFRSQEIGVQFRILGLPNVPAFVCDQYEFAAKGATDTFGQAMKALGGVIFPSGTQFRFQCNSLALDGQPNITLTGSIWYVRMET